MALSRFMRRAIDLAVENVRSGGGGPFGAVIVQGGQVVAEGANLVTSSNDPTAHAEIAAIRTACRQLGRFELRGCELYASCEPCPMCLGAIYWARLERVWFACSRHDAAEAGFDDGFIYSQIARPFPERSIGMAALMREEGLEAFRAWGKSTVKVPY